MIEKSGTYCVKVEHKGKVVIDELFQSFNKSCKNCCIVDLFEIDGRKLIMLPECINLKNIGGSPK